MIQTYLNRTVLFYTLKCLIGLSIFYTLYLNFPQHEFYWSMISVLLVLSPERNDATTLAFDRMKANVLGSSIGLLLFLIHLPNLFLICVGVVLAIFIGLLLKLNNSLRSMLAALVIVMIHEKTDSSWKIALERVGCVMAGCILALLLTLIFDYFSPAPKTEK